MTMVVLQLIVKIMFFLRIFDNISYLVTMIIQVISDLKIYIFFYTIFIFFFGIIFCVIGTANQNIPGKFKDEYDKVT